MSTYNTNNSKGRVNGNDEYIYNQTEANDTIRMTQEDVHNFDGVTIDENGNEIHVETPNEQRRNRQGFEQNPFGQQTGGAGADGTNPFGSTIKVSNFGGMGCIIAILIIFAILGLFFAGIVYFAKYILIGAVILGSIWGFGSLFE